MVFRVVLLTIGAVRTLCRNAPCILLIRKFAVCSAWLLSPCWCAYFWAQADINEIFFSFLKDRPGCAWVSAIVAHMRSLFCALGLSVVLFITTDWIP